MADTYRDWHRDMETALAERAAEAHRSVDQQIAAERTQAEAEAEAGPDLEARAMTSYQPGDRVRLRYSVRDAGTVLDDMSCEVVDALNTWPPRVPTGTIPVQWDGAHVFTRNQIAFVEADSLEPELTAITPAAHQPEPRTNRGFDIEPGG